MAAAQGRLWWLDAWSGANGRKGKGEGGAGNRLTLRGPRGGGQGGEDCTSVFSKSQPSWDSVQSREKGTLGFSGSDASRSVSRGGWAAARAGRGALPSPGLSLRAAGQRDKPAPAQLWGSTASRG